MVCDCEGKNVCRSRKMIGGSLGPAGIGIAFLGLLFLLREYLQRRKHPRSNLHANVSRVPAVLLLLIFVCQCGKEFKVLPILEDECNQTIIEYNEEGGMSECTVGV